MKLLTKYILTIVAFLAIALSANAGSVKMSVMNQNPYGISVGDLFYINITVSNLTAQPSKPASLPGAKVLYFKCTGTSTQMVSINGNTTQTVEYTYTITARATKEGKHTFGPITVGGEKSNTVTYTIGAAGSNAAPQSGRNSQSATQDTDANQGPKYIGKGDGNLFLRASVSKTNVYEQEAIVYTVKLYTSYSALKFIGAASAPKFEGFVIEESQDISDSLVPETYQGKSYATAIIARYIIFPQMTGTLKILGNTYTVSVDEREYYHDPFFGKLSYNVPLQLNVKPNDLSIDVKALPSPRPADFSGGVGKFSISSALPNADLKTNQAAQIVYTVTGSGNIKYVKLPDLAMSWPKEIDVFSPTTDVKSSAGIDRVTGTAKFDYSFMPNETGTYHIPEMKLVYFNPETGKYEESVAKGYTIHVDKGEASAKSQTKLKLVFNPELKKSVGSLKHEYRPYVMSFGYWLFYIVPVVALIVCVAAYRKYINMNADVDAARQRRANREARRRLARAKVCMKKNQTDRFYDELLNALWGYLGDKLKIKPSELSRDNVREIMLSHGVADDDINDVINLIDDAEFAKYTPMQANNTMSEMIDRAEALIGKLQNAFRKNDKSAMKSDNLNNTVIALLILMASTFAPSAFAKTGAEMVAKGDSAYNAGNYTEAIAIYKDVTANQGVSASLLYNLGNAYAKSDSIGRAVLCYERARRLNPTDKLINNNLNYLRSKVDDANRADAAGKSVKVVPDEQSFFRNVYTALAVNCNANMWAVLAAIVFVAMIAMVALYIFIKNVTLRKVGFFGAISLFVADIFLVIVALMAANAVTQKDDYIITEYKTPLLITPDPSSKPATTPLNAGTKVQVISAEDDGTGNPLWYKVRLNSDFIGWISSSDIEAI